VKAAAAVVVPAEIDVFAAPDTSLEPPPPALSSRRASRLGAIVGGAFAVLISLAVGLWIDSLVRDLFERAPWLGWMALAAAIVAILGMAALVVREIAALAKLSSIEKLKRSAIDAIQRDDVKAARAVIASLVQLVEAKPETAAGRRLLASTEGEIVDGADLVRLAEAEILGPLDARARVLVLDAAKRVSVVTAISPRALVDLAYVVFEAARLIRRLGQLYGGRPGALGFLRLSRSVLAHLAVTGAIAAGDDFVHQVVGQGLAAKLSARLGEGVVNGMMTARIGIAAMDAARPLPFTAARRPRLSDFLTSLASFSERKPRGPNAPDA